MTLSILSPRRLVLASRSPRRAQLLAELGLPLLTFDPPFADPPQPDHDPDPHGLAKRLAIAKGQSLLDSPPYQRQKEPADWIIAADTIVVAPDGQTLLGQPADGADARRMIRLMLKATHQVITGLAIFRVRSNGSCDRFVASDQASVHVGEIPDDDLEDYLKSNDWQGKAGGYNLTQMQRHWPISSQGDWTTVVGLPMGLIRQELQASRSR